MNFFKSIILILLTLVFVTGCCADDIRSTLRMMYDSKVVIPIDMITITNGTISPYSYSYKDSVSLLVIYYDYKECGQCRISNLYQLDTLFRLAESSNKFEVLVVFSPLIEETSVIVSQLVEYKYSYPISVDISGSFLDSNKFIPEDGKYHSFLTDKMRHPVFVGNPLGSSELWKVFMNKLNDLNNL